MIFFYILYFWESNLYSRFLIFAFWYLLSILYLYESNLQYPFLLRSVITGLIALFPFDSPFSPPGHLYLLPPSSLLYPTLWISLGSLGCGEHLGNWSQARLVSLLLTPPPLLLATSISFWSPLSPSSLFSSLWNSVNLSECSRLWRVNRELIAGQIALSPFDSPSSPPGHLYLPPPSSLLHVILWTYLSIPTADSLFTINLDVLSSVLYGWGSLEATVRIRLKARGRRLKSKTWELQKTPDSREH